MNTIQRETKGMSSMVDPQREGGVGCSGRACMCRCLSACALARAQCNKISPAYAAEENDF
jgi:hypothetical protein